MSIEQLTEEERARLENWCEVNDKALRIIDAQAAAVQALDEQVAQLTAELAAKQEDRDYWHDSSIAEGKAKLRAEGELRAQERATQQLSAEVARLTEALADAKENLRAANIAYDRLERDRDAARAECDDLRAEVARLTKVLAAAEAYGWRAPQEQPAETELTALTRDDGLGPRALEALRGR